MHTRVYELDFVSKWDVCNITTNTWKKMTWLAAEKKWNAATSNYNRVITNSNSPFLLSIATSWYWYRWRLTSSSHCWARTWPAPNSTSAHQACTHCVCPPPQNSITAFAENGTVNRNFIKPYSTCYFSYWQGFSVGILLDVKRKEAQELIPSERNC